MLEQARGESNRPPEGVVPHEEKSKLPQENLPTGEQKEVTVPPDPLFVQELQRRYATNDGRLALIARDVVAGKETPEAMVAMQQQIKEIEIEQRILAEKLAEVGSGGEKSEAGELPARRFRPEDLQVDLEVIKLLRGRVDAEANPSQARQLAAEQKIIEEQIASQAQWTELQRLRPDVNVLEYGSTPERARKKLFESEAIATGEERAVLEVAKTVNLNPEAVQAMAETPALAKETAATAARGTIKEAKAPEEMIKALLAERTAINRELRRIDERSLQAKGWDRIAGAAARSREARALERQKREVEKALIEAHQELPPAAAPTFDSQEMQELAAEFGFPKDRKISGEEANLNFLLRERADLRRGLWRLDEAVGQAKGLEKIAAIWRRLQERGDLQRDAEKNARDIERARVVVEHAREAERFVPPEGLAKALLEPDVPFQEGYLSPKDYAEFAALRGEALRAKEEIETAMERDGRRSPAERYRKDWTTLLTREEVARLQDIIARQEGVIVRLAKKWIDGDTTEKR